jgi:GNAT superfamily N-acetyltransferase
MMRDQQINHALAQITLPSQVSIRAWHTSDFASVRDLARAENWTTLSDRPDDGLQSWQHAWPALVATYQQQIIGFLRALTDEAVTLYVADLLVAPAWRGQGIGSGLLNVCHLLYPSVRFNLLSTEHADVFYQSQGFRPFRGFRKNF